MKLMVCSVFLACVSLSCAASLYGAEAVLRRRARSYGPGSYNTDPYGNSIDGGPIDAMNAMNVVDPLAPVDAVKEDSSEEQLPVDPATVDPGTVEEQAAEIQEQIAGLIPDPPAKEAPAEQAAEAQEQAPQQAEKAAVPDPDPPQPGPDNSNKEDGDGNGNKGVDAGTAADAAAQKQEQAAEAQQPKPDPPQAPEPPAQPDHGNGHQDGFQRNEDTKSRK